MSEKERTETADAEKIAAGWMERIGRHVKYAQARLHKVIENHRMYEGIAAERRAVEPGTPRANTCSLEFHRCVESVASAVDAVTFGDDPWYMPWSDEIRDDSIQASRLTQAVLDQQHEDMHLRTNVLRSVRWGLLHGTMIVHTPWTQRIRWKDEGDGWDKHVVFDGPTWEHVPLWQFHFEPGSLEIDDMQWASCEQEMTKEELQEHLNKLKRAEIPGMRIRDVADLDLKASATTEATEISQALSAARGYTRIEAEGKVLVDFCYGQHPTAKNPNDPDGKEAMPVFFHSIIVNGCAWAADGPSPYAHGELPFVKVVFLPHENDFYGIGLSHLLGNKLIGINERRNLMYDIVTMSLFGMWQRTGLEPGTSLGRIRLFPGKVFDQLVDGLMTMIPVNTSGLKMGMKMDEVDIEEMRSAAGATSNMQGITTGATATEIRSIASEAARRIATYAVILANEGLKKFLMRQADLNVQFMEDGVAVAITGQDGMPRGELVSRENILLRARFKMKVAVDLEFRRPMLRNLNTTIQQLGQILTVAPEMAAAIKPVIVQLSKKAQLLFGINPEISVPAESVQDALTAPPMPELPPGAEPQSAGLSGMMQAMR